MYWLEERTGTCDPFGYAIASLWMVSLLEVSVHAMIVNRRSSNVIRSTVRHRVISIDDVLAVRRLES